MKVNPIKSLFYPSFKQKDVAFQYVPIKKTDATHHTYTFLNEVPDFITTFYTGEPQMANVYEVYAHDTLAPIGKVATTTEAKLMLIHHYKSSHLLHNFSGISVKANTIFPLFSFDPIDLQA